MQLLLVIAIAYTWLGLLDMYRTAKSITVDPSCPTLSAKLVAFGTNALTCSKCASYWIGIAVTGNIIIASFASMAFDLFDRIRNRLFL